MSKLALISLSFLSLTGVSYGANPDDITVERTVKQSSLGQPVYTIGQRPQRVRFMESHADLMKAAFGSSEQETKMRNDPLKLQGNWSWFAAFGSTPASSGLREFSAGGNDYSLIVNPALILCAADALKLIKVVGDKKSDIFKRWQISEVNIFLKPVRKSKPGDTKVQIAPVAQVEKDPALNVQVGFQYATSKCLLPSETALTGALVNASKSPR